MRRLQVLIIVFGLALTLPLAYLVVRTYQGMAQEETAELRYFADTLFDQMEAELARFVAREESRSIDDYNYGPAPQKDWAQVNDIDDFPTDLPDAPYILGYFQNNPDGSFQTPLAPREEEWPAPEKIAGSRRFTVAAQLREANRVFNTKKTSLPERPVQPELKPQPKPEPTAPLKSEVSQKKAGPANRYLTRSREEKEHLGQTEPRVQRITPNQASNLASLDKKVLKEKVKKKGQKSPPKADFKTEESGKRKAPAEVQTDYRQGYGDEADADVPSTGGSSGEGRSMAALPQPPPPPKPGAAAMDEEMALPEPAPVESSADDMPMDDFAPEAPQDQFTPYFRSFEAEVDPMQSVFLDSNLVFVFRRIVVDGQVYRQGVVIKIRELLEHLAASHFMEQPMARFAKLSLAVAEEGHERIMVLTGVASDDPLLSLSRTFPRPFAFLQARLTCDKAPPLPGRRTLSAMIGILAGVILIGLFAIYKSASRVMELSERKTGFVSSVTHELKTPLTNIRMYIEMLEQGIARNPEREDEYFRIVKSEGARLSRLINNVLEFSKLQTKNRHLNMVDGDFNDVIDEVMDVMREKIRQEGFQIHLETEETPSFRYDRETMVQVLINLIENSLKFGKTSTNKDIRVRTETAGDKVIIEVADSGPGIPPQALKKVFDDFFRVDNSLTRSTRGTGIGLALVKKFVTAMGGEVSAKNNAGPGCTITISMPKKKMKIKA